MPSQNCLAGPVCRLFSYPAILIAGYCRGLNVKVAKASANPYFSYPLKLATVDSMASLMMGDFFFPMVALAAMSPSK